MPPINVPPLVSLRRVDKTYANGVVALRGVDLTIGEGEFLSLLGSSGCGKSTVLRLVAGLVGVTAGTIEWSRRDDPAQRRHDVGFVFQEPTLMPWATVAANVRMPLTLLAVPRAEADKRVAERSLSSVSTESSARTRGSYPEA